MISKKWLTMGIVMIMGIQNHAVFSGEVNATQFMYMVKKLFPDQKDVAIFISQESFQSQRSLIERASAQNGFTAKIYIIQSSADVGTRIRELPENSVLVVYNSDVLMKKSTQLYILKNCKERKIAVFTPDRGYSELGALFGLISESAGSLELVLNLKHNEYLRPSFTDDFIEQAGITEVIQ